MIFVVEVSKSKCPVFSNRTSYLKHQLWFFLITPYICSITDIISVPLLANVVYAYVLRHYLEFNFIFPVRLGIFMTFLITVLTWNKPKFKYSLHK